MNYFLVAGISQGLLLSLILFYKTWLNRNNSWIIALLILSITGIISGFLMNQILGEPFGSLIADPLIFLIGPSFYLYALSFTRRFKWIDYVKHFSLFVLYLPVLFWFYTTSFDGGMMGIQEIYSSAFAISLGVLKFAHLFSYIILTFNALSSHEFRISQSFADLSGRDLKWLKFMTGTFVFLVIASLIFYIFGLQFPDFQESLTLINLSLLSLYILIISFFALQQGKIFDYDLDFNQNIQEERSTPLYEKSGLKPEDIDLIRTKIARFMEEKGYHNSEITLSSMAETLGESAHRLSEVLGKHMQTSFYDLINKARVEDIQVALRDPDKSKYSILGIAFDYGYNSKSTFNTAFKKFTGTTPSQFRKI